MITGWRRLCAGGVYRSLEEHWDGDRWTSAALNGVGAWGRRAAWVVGATSSGVGRRWSSVPTPGIPGYDGRLMAVAGFAGGELWAVGSASRGAGPQRVLILHRCASSPS